LIKLFFFTSIPKNDVLEVIKKKPQADESLGERSVLQVDAVIELVEDIFENFIMEIEFFNRRRGGRGKFIIIGTHQHFFWKLLSVWP
jgi:hypothetical protein